VGERGGGPRGAQAAEQSDGHANPQAVSTALQPGTHPANNTKGPAMALQAKIHAVPTAAQPAAHATMQVAQAADSGPVAGACCRTIPSKIDLSNSCLRIISIGIASFLELTVITND
jgi:hypothetical protein